MTDARKTLAQLKTALFQDSQAAGSITAQDMRDLIFSMGEVPYGTLYLSASGATLVLAQSTYLKAVGTTLAGDLRGMTMPASNRLTYTGAVPYQFQVVCAISMTAAGNNKVFGFKLYKYDASAAAGAVIDGSIINRKIATGADEGAAAVAYSVELDTNDYLELWIENQTDDTDLTITCMVLSAQGVLK